MQKNEQIQILCKLRDIYRSISEFELNFQREHEICFNEAMLLCTLGSGRQSSSEIAEALGLSNSNASKVIKSLESKALIKRILGEADKRHMYFELTAKGKNCIRSIKCNSIDVPEILQCIVKK